MHCLVIGGGGFLGSNLAAALCRAGEQVRCFDVRLTPAVPLPASCEMMLGDLTQESDIAKALDGIEVVFHMAAPFWIAESQRQPARDIELNLVRGVQLLALCVKQQVRRIVFPSSGGAVYGVTRRDRLAETDPALPVVSYGIIKFALERYLAMFHESSGLEYAALRLSNPYGPGQAPNRGQGVIPTMMECAKTGVPFHLFAALQTRRDYLYVDDAVAALVAAGKKEGVLAEVLNIGSGQGMDLTGLIAAVEAVTGKELVVEVQPPRGFDAPSNVLDCARAKAVLGWEPTTSLETGLQKTWAWIQSLK
ncbi:MAG TPA: NAD-dependent epimerase/dehydratase family protein [Planctomycetota bacterium]|nr:NAD-dependent epimerase/dehydratase family protein [Planctomycetota bacterium]